ncbi:HEAT repeat protein [Anatilimnocola aggregata]|uniref:HEAT repeat protein n=1 Tax=Anatilimnocola aggregata TaxID=2528021 RepID=A0A517YG30_9BACT|nr:HEAT repeat domain-containing protein [Anatilimnocola aggregata]QDU29161.1 HEAT repeat protein [Anatilimnocola aggregata]
MKLSWFGLLASAAILGMALGCGVSQPVNVPAQPLPTNDSTAAPDNPLSDAPAQPAIDGLATSPEKLPEKAPPPTTTDVTPPLPVLSVAELVAKLAIPDERQAAAVALCKQGPEAVPALLKALDHQDWQVRAAAVFALGQLGKESAAARDRLEVLAEKDENANVRDAATFALDAIAGK